MEYQQFEARWQAMANDAGWETEEEREFTLLCLIHALCKHVTEPLTAEGFFEAVREMIAAERGVTH